MVRPPPRNPRGGHSISSPLKQACYGQARWRRLGVSPIFLVRRLIARGALFSFQVGLLSPPCATGAWAVRVEVCCQIFCIALVDVRAKLDSAVGIGERSLVNHEDRDRGRQHPPIGIAEGNPLVDQPSTGSSQQERGQIARVLHAHATVALTAVVAGEQVPSAACVVQVGTSKRSCISNLSFAKAVPAPGQLLDRAIVRASPCGGDPDNPGSCASLGRTSLVAIEVGDVPRRIEQQGVDRGLEFRASACRLRQRRRGWRIPAGYREVQHELRARRIDPDPVWREVARQPAPAFEVCGNDLLQAWPLGSPSIDGPCGRRALGPSAAISSAAPRSSTLLAGLCRSAGLAAMPGVGRRMRRQRSIAAAGLGVLRALSSVAARSIGSGLRSSSSTRIFDRHGTAGERVGIGEHGIRQQKLAVDGAPARPAATSGRRETARGRARDRRPAARD